MLHIMLCEHERMCCRNALSVTSCVMNMDVVRTVLSVDDVTCYEYGGGTYGALDVVDLVGTVAVDGARVKAVRRVVLEARWRREHGGRVLLTTVDAVRPERRCKQTHTHTHSMLS